MRELVHLSGRQARDGVLGLASLRVKPLRQRVAGIGPLPELVYLPLRQPPRTSLTGAGVIWGLTMKSEDLDVRPTWLGKARSRQFGVGVLVVLSLLPACVPRGIPVRAFGDTLAQSWSLAQAGKDAEALRLAKSALAMARADPGPSRVHLEAALHAVAQAELGLEHADEVIAALTEVLPIATANQGWASDRSSMILKHLSLAYLARREIEVARQHMREAIRAADAQVPADEVKVAYLLGKLAWQSLALGDRAGTLAAVNRAIGLAERPGREAQLAEYLRIQARSFMQAGALGDAEAAVRRALGLDAARGEDASLDLAEDDETLGDILLGAARAPEALARYDACLAIREKRLNPSSPRYEQLANAVLAVANAYAQSHAFDRAIALYERAIAMHRQLGGPDSLEAAFATVFLANVYSLTGDDRTALQKLDPALEIMRRTRAPRTVLRPALETEAALLSRTDAAKARGMLEELAEEERREGDLVAYAATVQRLGTVCMTLGDRDCTIRSYQAGLLAETRGGALSSLRLGMAHGLLGSGWYAFGEYDGAVDEYAASLDTSIEREGTLEDVHHVDTDLHGYLGALWRASRPPRGSPRSTAATAFMVAQLDQQTRAAKALEQVAARTAAGQGPLAELVRRDQDLQAQRAALMEAYGQVLSEPDFGGRAGKLDGIRTQVAALEQEQRTTRAALAKGYPAYRALTAPPVVTPEQLQARLGEGDLLLMFDFGYSGGFVWALDRDGLAWAKVTMTDTELANEVTGLRAGLDGGRGATLGVSLVRGNRPLPSFDRARAYRLYETLFSPFAERMQKARQLVVVPTGALQSLPLGVLVTRDPADAPRTFESYRDTAWLARDKALTVLPSASVFRGLRAEESAHAPRKAFVGIGAPDLSADEQERGLSPLPNTKRELERIANALGATTADVYVGPRIREDAVKKLDLRAYRVVAFATHGLRARELPELAEPALVLSAPAPGDHEDGFLAASEVAEMHLDADWVILSACNTAAGDGSSRADALSGLARAFFYAGARAILASHWAVYSDAAADLTTRTFDLLHGHPKLSRAEALRRATVAVIESPLGSDPAYWGPFSFIGDGDSALGP